MTESDDELTSRPGFDRDLVSFYSRLTRTLEDICSRGDGCGREALAKRLLALRRDGADGDDKSALHAVVRCFKRMDLLPAGAEAEAFVAGFVGRMAESVNRPERQAAGLLRLFCCGDELLSLRPVCGTVPVCQQCQLTRDCRYYNKPRKPEMAMLTPGQRLWSGNEEALSDSELLGLLLFGEKGTGLEELVERLHSRYGRLRALFRADPGEFMSIREMQRSQAFRLSAFATLFRRLLREEREDRLRIASSRDLYDRYAPELRDYRVEAVILVMLDQQNNVIRDKWFCGESPGIARIGMGDLLRSAIREFVSRVALVHNHPSGDVSPSMEDVDFTRRFRASCDLLDLAVVDHVIISEGGYFSFADSGMLRG